MANETPPAKPWWKSKTLITNFIALLSLTVPAVAQWLKENPVDAVAALGAVNVLLRFVTGGKLYWLSDDSDDQSGEGSSAPSLGAGGRRTDRGAQWSAEGDNKQRMAGFPWLVASACAAMFLLLPGCDSAAVATLRALPITVGIEGQHGTYGYSNQTGLSIAIKNAKVKEQKSRGGEVPSEKFQVPTPELWNPRYRYFPRRMCLENAPGLFIELDDLRESGPKQDPARPWVVNPSPPSL